MLYRKRFCLREIRNSPKPESGRSAFRNAMPAKTGEGKKKKLKRMPGSAAKKVSDIMREVMDIWESRKAGICLEDIL